MAKVPMAQAIGMPSEGELLLLTLRRWLPNRIIVAVMDGEFAAIDLLHRLRRYMVVITRLRLDACLFDPPSAYQGRGRYLTHLIQLHSRDWLAGMVQPSGIV
jgi:hypothetical protein